MRSLFLDNEFKVNFLGGGKVCSVNISQKYYYHNPSNMK